MSHIVLKKVKVHNLKEVHLSLPKNQLIVFSGISGSGKSSLAFDTIHVEGQRRYIESLPRTLRKRLGNFPKPDAEIFGLTPTLAIDQRSLNRSPRSTVGTITGIYDFLRVLYARIGIPHCPISGEVVSPQSDQQIAAELKRHSPGTRMVFLTEFIKNKKGAFKEEMASLLRKGWTRIRLDGTMIELTEDIHIDKRKMHTIEIVVDRLMIHPDEENRLMESIRQALDLGKGTFVACFPEAKSEKTFSQLAYSPASGFSYEPLEPVDFSFNHPSGICPTCQGLGKLHGNLCFACMGARIKPYARATTVGGQRIDEVTAMPIKETVSFFSTLTLSDLEMQIASDLLKEMLSRLKTLVDLGLEYLTLDRTMPSLSGGEAQRVRISGQLGSGLVDITYVLDEPSIGLHPQDHKALLHTLFALRDLGNTIIVVEHDREFLHAADSIVDIGPFAGKEGGNILFYGMPFQLLHCTTSLTADYLSGRRLMPTSRGRVCKQKMQIRGAAHHNLQHIDVAIPLHGLIAITGVSGSGKSSLILDTLFPALSNILHKTNLFVGQMQALQDIEPINSVIAIDQAPIGRTPRSNPATFMKIFDAIRTLYAQLPDSISAGFHTGTFSFNSPEGACTQCNGMGMVCIDMDVLEDAWIPCSRCDGKRFEADVLSILFRGKSIADVLEMSIQDATTFFAHLPSISEKLDLLVKVGLGYLSLGQPSPTLSGGEAQRMKLARELGRTTKKQTLYILDEPTTGLHFHDVAHLITLLQNLIDKGNSCIVIEHNLDLIRAADWVIELGPVGGAQGGILIGEGTPEDLASLNTPTGKALRTKTSVHKKQRQPHTQEEFLCVQGAEQHTLKAVSTALPRGKMTICTGPSGSGKSSFAFDTVYAESQRRYSEALSPYARSLIALSPKPKVEKITGLSPAIAIEQKTHAAHLRSTVGTLTEIFDDLRLLYAHMGIAFCPKTGEKMEMIINESIAKRLLALPQKSKITILSPLKLKGGFPALKQKLQAQGYLRIELNGTLYALDEEIPFDPNRKNSLNLVIDRLILSPTSENRLREAIACATALSSGTMYAKTETDSLFFQLSFSDPSTNRSYATLTPQMFSFNSEQGMCLECRGLGIQFGAQLLNHPKIAKLSPKQLFAELCKSYIASGSTLRIMYENKLLTKNQAQSKRNFEQEPTAIELFSKCMHAHAIAEEQPIENCTKEQQQILFFGEKERSPFRWIGFNVALEMVAKSGHSALRHALSPLLETTSCSACNGSRLNPLVRNVSIQGMRIGDLCKLSIDALFSWIEQLKSVPPFLEEVRLQIRNRLACVQQLGMGYIALERSATTLSSGEMQRMHLARHLGGNLTGCLYVLDEPTIGLHPRDIMHLHNALNHLLRIGNTLLLVEHDPSTIKQADFLLDFGPRAGKEGGYIVAQGTPTEILQNPNSLTGAYLNGKKQCPYPTNRRKGMLYFSIQGARLHNLKNLHLEIPIGLFVCVTGVSGSGKTTLAQELIQPAVAKAMIERQNQVVLRETLFSGLNAFDQLIAVDATLPASSTRADVSTYSTLHLLLRQFFSQLPEARAKGLAPKHFSWNQRSGMCPSCVGQGTKRIYLQYIAPIHISCPACNGYRLNPLSLSITYKGKHLGQLLQLNARNATSFLPEIPKIHRILQSLISVGLDYIPLGQELATLSGGEKMRLKLAREFAKKTKPKTLYLFDEPTIGLHVDDVAKLIPLLHSLVDQGHSIIVIEHNLDIIMQADHIIDMGPESGDRGGEIVTMGTPEEIARHPRSYTGAALRHELRHNL